MKWIWLKSKQCNVDTRNINRLPCSHADYFGYVTTASSHISQLAYYDVIKWEKILALCAGIHSSPVNSPHKYKWRGALMFSLICAWTKSWENNRYSVNLKCHLAHCNDTRWLDRNIWLVSSHVENGFLSQFDARVGRMVSYPQSFTVHAMHTSLCNGDHIIWKESFHPILRKSFLWVTHTCIGNLSHYWFSIMACGLFRAKSLSQPMLEYQLNLKEQTSVKLQTYPNNKIRLKMPSTKWWSFCIGLDVFIQHADERTSMGTAILYCDYIYLFTYRVNPKLYFMKENIKKWCSM